VAIPGPPLRVHSRRRALAIRLGVAILEPAGG
jgi:hypothetical protein